MRIAYNYKKTRKRSGKPKITKNFILQMGEAKVVSNPLKRLLKRKKKQPLFRK